MGMLIREKVADDNVLKMAILDIDDLSNNVISISQT